MMVHLGNIRFRYSVAIIPMMGTAMYKIEFMQRLKMYRGDIIYRFKINNTLS
jgi:hypothetical protein